MKKIIWALFAVIVFMLLITSLGSALFTGKFELTVYHNGEIMLKKVYKIKTSTVMNVLFKYGGNYYKFYQKNSSDAKVRDLSCLNDEINGDLQRIIDRTEEPVIERKLLWSAEKAEFNFVEGKNGLKVEKQKLIENIYKEISYKTTIALPTKEIEQSITMEELKKRTYQRSVFSTCYSTSKANRKHNIELATKKLNGAVVPAKSQLSFNKIVGPRTIQNGFKSAGIISGGAFVQGVGGGVCQVSTTLYNAWIRAGLDVINAVNHSLPVSYVGPSLDAMVSSKNDLLLFNNTEHDVYIKAHTQNGRIYFTIYGYYTPERTVIRNNIIKILPCNEYDILNIPLDWKENETFRILASPRNGLVSCAYKDVYIGNKLIKTEKLRTNTYSPQRGKMVKRTIKEEDEELDTRYINPSFGFFNKGALFGVG